VQKRIRIRLGGQEHGHDQSTIKKLYDSPSRIRLAKYKLGEVVKHRVFPFRGVVFDIDPVFNNTEEWWQSIPRTCGRPRTSRSIICSPRTLKANTSPMCRSRTCCRDTSGKPVRHPQIAEAFERATTANIIRATQ